MSTEQITFRIPAAADVEIDDQRADKTGVHDYTIRFRAFPDSDGNVLYEYRGSRTGAVRTVGDLTLNDIGKTRIALGTGDGRVEGVIGWIGSDIWGGARTVHYRTTYEVKASITVGGITLHGLYRDHPCEVIA